MPPQQQQQQEGVYHTPAFAIYIKKYHLKAKRRITKTQIFCHAKTIIFKKSSKRNQKSFKILKLYNYSQVSTQAKISSFKNAHIKINRPIIIIIIT
jgi:hypothetical protein